MGTHLRVLSESYPMNTNMTGLTSRKCSTVVSNTEYIVAGVEMDGYVEIYFSSRWCVSA